MLHKRAKMARKKARQRPDPVPFVRDDLMMPAKLTAKGLFAWRQDLKRYLAGRDRHCRSCGCSLFAGRPMTSKLLAFAPAVHMHEAIFPRNLVTGWPKAWRILIHCELNCTLLCSDCNMSEHGKHPPDPADVWREHCELYGVDTMLEWHDSLLFKQEENFVTQTRKGNQHGKDGNTLFS